MKIKQETESPILWQILADEMSLLSLRKELRNQVKRKYIRMVLIYDHIKLEPSGVWPNLVL